MAAPNPRRQRATRDKLGDLFAHTNTVCVIHYACQSFENPGQGGSPRVAAIAVRNLGTGETAAFSIHQELELVEHNPSSDRRLATLERAMLDRFFRFMAENRNMRFLHWNMRDIKFGFAALEHRFRVLGGEPVVLHDGQKHDLALMLAAIYGTHYARRPHFESLARKNRLALAGYVTGKDEPELFAAGHYFEVLQSVLCKVALVALIATHAHDGTLKTDANWWTMNQGRLREAYEFFIENPVYGLGMAAITGFGAALKLLEYLGV